MLTLWCGAGLSYDSNETALKDAFPQHGDIIQGRLVLILFSHADPVVRCKSSYDTNETTLNDALLTW
jgi:hypothetical protein